LGIVTDHIYTLSNIDGSGRQIKIAQSNTNPEIIMIEAGCFRGTYLEFIAKAQNENKQKYVILIGGFCANLVTIKLQETN
jgi:hypothetical protein